jgi:hypothetical protein
VGIPFVSLDIFYHIEKFNVAVLVCTIAPFLVVMETVCNSIRCVVLFLTCCCVTAVYVFYCALKVLCCNIYNVFVDSSTNGDTAIESVS